ncbi:MAG: pyrroline-5-carboxylate reductase dimerization domain-containing protein, partial [Brevundimonas sp.]
LARGALRSAAAGAATGASLAELIDRVASPGGATRAGLDALRHGGLDLLATATVAAAMRRSRELG